MSIDVTPGTGKTIGTETISSTEYQLIKLVDATASSTTRTGVAANPLQVSLANTAANSTAVKTDSSAVTQPVSQSGTWTVQPGNTANTTAWKVDGSAVTQPVSIAAAVQPYALVANYLMGTTAAITDTTSTQVIASQSGAKIYVTSLLVTNSHTTVGTFVKILDGSTIIWEGYAAAAGGGFACSFPVPIVGSTTTALNAQAVTTGANFIVSAAGYKV